MIYNQQNFMIIVLFTLINIILLCLIFKIKKHKEILLFIGVMLYIITYGNYFIYYNKKLSLYQEPMTTLKSLNNIVQNLEENVRYNSNDFYYNIGLYSNRMFVTSWNTNIEGSSFDFYNSLEIYRDVFTQIPISDKNLQEFLSIKYIILNYLDENLVQIYGEPIKKNEYYIYTNENYKPFGIDYNNYFLESDFKNIPKENKSYILNNAIVINEEQLKEYKNILSKYQPENKYESDLEKNEFILTANGFIADIVSPKEKILVYTIPYSNGWNATLNNKKVEIEQVDNGLMAIKINKGNNKIEFKYCPPGLKIGIITTIFSISGTIVYVIFKKRVKNT